MHYILKKSRPSSKKGIYLQIYINDYISGKGKVQKSFKSLGYLEDLTTEVCPDPIAFYSLEVKKLNDNLKANNVKQIEDIVPTKNLGYFLLKAMFDKINMDYDIKLANQKRNFQFELSDFIRTMTYAQINNPSSKHKAFEKVIPSLLNCNCYSYDQILDTVRYLGEDYESFIEILNHNIEKVYPRKYDTTFFDCTNYYFEIDQEDDVRRRGPCKENRNDPIIGQALLLDADQIPLAMTMFPGNESERPQLRKHIEDLKTRYKLGSNTKIVQVADKGLNCAKNIYAASKEANDGYIFSKSVHGKNLSKIEKQWVTLENNENVWFDVLDKKGNIKYRYKECVDEFEYKFEDDNGKAIKFTIKEKRIVTYNKKLADKQKREINKEIEKAKCLSLREAYKDEYGDSIKYLNIVAADSNGEVVKAHTSLKKEKIEEDLKFAGYNLLVTSETSKTATEIYDIYHRLWKIEESFRIMKSYLDARPVYLQNIESIYGHFLICYIGLTILRLLELKVFNDKLSVGEIIEFIRDFNVTEYAEAHYINNAHKACVKKEIKDAIGISSITNLYLNKKDIDSIIDAYL